MLRAARDAVQTRSSQSLADTYWCISSQTTCANTEKDATKENEARYRRVVASGDIAKRIRKRCETGALCTADPMTAL